MSFSCDCDSDGYTSVYRVTEHKARKQYRCVECSADIKPGDTYQYRFMVYDGEPSTDHTCERCADLIAAFTDVGYCYEIGGFLHSYAEWLDMSELTRPKWLNDIFKKPTLVHSSISEGQ